MATSSLLTCLGKYPSQILLKAPMDVRVISLEGHASAPRRGWWKLYCVLLLLLFLFWFEPYKLWSPPPPYCLGFVCFVVLNPCVLSAIRVYFGLLVVVSSISNLPPQPRSCRWTSRCLCDSPPHRTYRCTTRRLRTGPLPVPCSVQILTLQGWLPSLQVS